MSTNIQKLLRDPTENISFENLTESAKNNLLETNIDFQGFSTTFDDLIGYDKNILRHLTSDNIQKLLIENEKLKIGKAPYWKVEYSYIERQFMNVNIEPRPNHGNHYENEKKTIEEICELAEDSETFLLSDYAGSGKTVSFKYFAEALKDYNDENVWVSYIELRSHTNVLDTIDNKELGIDEVLEILMNLVETETELERQIFKKLFSKGKVILLFDGFDEVSPRYTEPLIRFFDILDDDRPRNQYWISTRPHLLEKLQGVFDVPAFKFAPFSTEEKENCISTLLDDNNIYEVSAQKKIIGEIISYLRKLRPNYCGGQDIDIFIVINSFVEYYIKNSVKHDDRSIYDIFTYLIEKQKELNAPKIPNKERDNDCLLTIWDYHRIEAFPGPNSLAIKKKWLKDQKNWTPEMLQRYGFMTDNSDKSERRFDRHNFVHEAYRSFFAAQFIINFLFDDNENTSDEDLKCCIETFNNMIRYSSKMDLYSDFLISYFKSHGKDKPIHERVRKVICDNFQQINTERCYSDTSCKYANFLSIDPVIAAKYFKLDEEVTLLDEYVLNEWMCYRHTITDAAEISFGPNWHRKFNHSVMTTNEDIERMKGTKFNEIKWNQDKNLLKICEIYFNSASLKMKNLFFAKVHSIYCFNGTIQLEILSRMHKIQDEEQFAEKCFIKIYYDLLAPEAVKFIQNRIEDYFSSNRIKQLLFEEYPNWTPLLIQSLHSKDSEVFRLTRDFYVKYMDSWDQIQKLLTETNSFNFFVACTTTFYSDYKEFIKEVFATDMSKIIPKAQNSIYIDEFLQCDNTKDFVDWILSYNEEEQ
jgi:hypothetical protein